MINVIGVHRVTISNLKVENDIYYCDVGVIRDKERVENLNSRIETEEKTFYMRELNEKFEALKDAYTKEFDERIVSEAMRN